MQGERVDGERVAIIKAPSFRKGSKTEKEEGE